MEPMYYIGLDVHKRKISYCLKDSGGKVYSEGSLSATRLDLDVWMKTLPQPWSAAMEATMFTGWIYTSPLPKPSRASRGRKGRGPAQSHPRYDPEPAHGRRVALRSRSDPLRLSQRDSDRERWAFVCCPGSSPGSGQQAGGDARGEPKHPLAACAADEEVRVPCGHTRGSRLARDESACQHPLLEVRGETYKPGRGTACAEAVLSERVSTP